MNICSVCQQCYDDSVTICSVENHGNLTQARQENCLLVEGYRIDSRFESYSPVELFRATHLASEKSVLIKFIEVNDSTDELQKDLQAVAGIQHPNLARTFEFGQISGNEFFVVLEDIGGQNLREHLAKSSLLLERHAIKIARQVAEGLEVLHAAGVIHRTVNLANIYFTSLEDHKFEVKLQNYDFGGIVQKIVANGANGIDAKTDVLRYFSPEQFTDAKVDFRTDIYSLAVVFYEMLLGASPYDSLNSHSISKYVFKERDVEKLHFDLRALLAYTLRESLQHRVDMRPPTTNNFVRQLRHIELIATPSDISIHDAIANQLKQKRLVNTSQIIEPKPIEEQIAVEKIVSNPEFNDFEVSSEETFEVAIIEEIELQKNEPKDELQVEILKKDHTDSELTQKELEDVPAFESLSQAQIESVNFGTIDDEGSEFDGREDSLKIVEDDEYYQLLNEQTENYELNTVDKFALRKSEELFESIHITDEDFEKNEELETYLTQTIDVEKPNWEKQEDFEDFQLLDKQIENEEINIVDSFDRIEGEQFFDEIHITNSDSGDTPLTGEDFDETLEDYEETEFAEDRIFERNQINLFEYIDYEKPEFIEESIQKEPISEQHIMNSFGAYTQTDSYGSKRNYIYIAGVLALFVFGGFIMMRLFLVQSQTSSLQTNPSSMTTNQSIVKENENNISQDKMQETETVNEKDPNPQQIQWAEKNELQKTEKTLFQTSSKKSHQNPNASRSKKENDENASAEKINSKVQPTKKLKAKRQNKPNEDLMKKDNEKSKPTVIKSDGKTRPRIVPNVDVKN